MHHPYIKSDLLSCFWLFFPAPAIGELSSAHCGTGKGILHHRVWVGSALGLQIHLQRRDAPFPQSIPQGSAQCRRCIRGTPTSPRSRGRIRRGPGVLPSTLIPGIQHQNPGIRNGYKIPPGTNIKHQLPRSHRAHRDAPRRTTPGPLTPFPAPPPVPPTPLRNAAGVGRRGGGGSQWRSRRASVRVES